MRSAAWLARLEPDGTVLRTSLQRYRVVLAILLALDAFAALVLVLGSAGSRPSALLMLLVGCAATTLLVARGLLNLPLYAIDRQGFHLPRLGLLPWTAIAHLRWERYRGERWLGVVPHDRQRLARLGRVRSLSRVNVRLGYSPLQIDPRQVGLTPEELAALIERYLPGARIDAASR